MVLVLKVMLRIAIFMLTAFFGDSDNFFFNGFLEESSNLLGGFLLWEKLWGSRLIHPILDMII